MIACELAPRNQGRVHPGVWPSQSTPSSPYASLPSPLTCRRFSGRQSIPGQTQANGFFRVVADLSDSVFLTRLVSWLDMGSVMINLARSDRVDSSHTMLGGATDPSESLYRSSSRQASHPSQLETGSSRSTSTSTTPTPSTAPPSASVVGSARLPAHQHHDVPGYIRRQSSQSLSQPPVRAPSTMSASIDPFPETAPMTSSSTNDRPSDNPSHPAAHSSQNPRSIQQSSAGSHTSAPHYSSQPFPNSSRLQPSTRSLRSLGGSAAGSPNRVKVRDLSHIHDFASEELMAQSQGSGGAEQWPQNRQYEISSMPVTDIIEMVAGLLTKITTTNDKHHEDVHRHIPPADGNTTLSPQATSVLAFHGKNVPSISILSYLTRVHKYCPTTYEVFLSLLVYFDRMTEIVNKGKVQRLRRRWGSDTAVQSSSAAPPRSSDSIASQPSGASPMVTPPSSTGMTAQDPNSPSTISPSLYPQGDNENLSQFFVVDSFNIHRLVIAGVTCASKFFSDVFYTNSRYAKVLFPTNSCIERWLTDTGRRTPPCGAQPSRAPISDSQ